MRSSGERIAVAVMPFQNMTKDSTKNSYGEIIQINLTSFLSGYPKELKVLETESIDDILKSNGLSNYALITPSLALSASQKLNTDVFIFGNVVKSGDIIRFYTQLTDSKTKAVIKSFQLEGSSKEENLIPMVDSLTRMVGNYILISKLEKENIEFSKYTNTKSPEAYRYYIYAKDAYYKQQFNNALDWSKKSLQADSNFTWAMRFMISSYESLRNMEEVRKWCLKWYSKKDKMDDIQKIYVELFYADYFKTPNDAISYLQQLQQIDDQPHIHRSLL